MATLRACSASERKRKEAISESTVKRTANRNHAKIRNQRRTIARDVTDRLCRFKVKQGVLLIYFIYSTLSLKTRSFTIDHFIETR